MFPLPISMPCFKSIIFLSIYSSTKVKLFLQKMQKFRVLGALPPDPRASRGRGLCSQTPFLWRLGLRPQTHKTAPPMRISGYAPALSSNVLCANPTHKYPNCLFNLLLTFATTYLCKSGFSALVHIKNKSSKSKES